MKKHRLDELFSERLSNHTLPPQRASWEEMQKRLNPQPVRRIGAGWRYAAAASVLLFTLAGWWVWKSTDTDFSADTGQLTNVQNGETQKSRSTDQPMAMGEEFAQSAIKAGRPENRPEVKPSLPGKHTGKTAKSVTVEPEVNEQPEEVMPINASAELVAVRKPEEPPVREQKPLETERTLVVKIDEPVIVAALDDREVLPVEDDTPKKKKVRIGRLLRQLNNLREGEPVDFQEAGVDPGAILAKASERVEAGREKIAESYESLRSKAFSKQSNNK